MGIVFFCQSCGARFEVDARMAGKRGRCRKCGQLMKIPRAEEIASMTALPVPASAGVTPAGRTAPIAAAADADGPSIGAWLKAGLSQVALAPLTVDRMPRPKKPDPLDDAEDSKPYVLDRPMVESRGGVRVQDNILVRLWRRGLGSIQKVFRWINASAYFVSIPFIIILLFGTAVKNRHVAIFGATFVVVLNLGRLAAAAVDLVLVPFRDGLNVRRLRKPARRAAEPLLTIAAVFLGFSFIPWLRGTPPGPGNIVDRIREGTKVLEKEIEGELEADVEKARKLDAGKLREQAREELKRIGEKVQPTRSP